MSRRLEILNRIPHVQAFPPSIIKATQLLNDPEADILEVARAVELDPGLTANLLKMANSSYFGGMTQYTSVRDAMVRLGMHRCQQLLVTAGFMPHIKDEIKGYDMPVCSLVHHAVTTAVSAECLGKMLKIAYPPYTFTAGMLASIGKTVLGAFMEVDAQPILNISDALHLCFNRAEKEVLGIDHAEVGALLLRHWGLPGPICNAVRWHLEPDRAETPDTAIDLVHWGTIQARTMGAGLGLDGLAYCASRQSADRLGLTVSTMDACLTQCVDEVAEIWDLLNTCET